MTEIEKWENPGQVERAMTRGLTRLVDWAAEADAAYTLAQKLTSTVFCPEPFRGKPADAAAAMLSGGELGLSPLTALSAFDVIQGRAAARAITLRALVQSRGHEMVLVESTTTRCRMKGRRSGSSEWQSVTWTIDRARELGLVGKDNWRKQPQTMLVARATAELARLIASDALLGIAGGYSIEEIADGATGDVTLDLPAAEPGTDPAPVPGKRTLSRRQHTPAGADAPDAADQSTPLEEVDGTTVEDAETEHTDSPPPPQDPDAITPAQLKKIGAGMRDLGIAERDKALEYVSRAVGREVASRNELSKDEAHLLIDAIEFDLTQPPDGGE